MTAMQEQTIHLLLVEDNPGDRDLVLEYLEMSGLVFQVESASTLRDALTKLAQGKFDLALLDLGLPDSQGLDTAQAVIESHPTLPLIVLTGHDDDQVAREAIKNGAQDYILKGKITPEVVERAIRYAIERKSVENELTAIYENAPILLMLVDSQRRIRRLNKLAAAFSDGMKKKDFIGLRGGDALRCVYALESPDGCGVSPHCVDCPVRDLVLHTLETGEPSAGVEVCLTVSGNDQNRDVFLSVSTAQVSLQNDPAVLIAFQDITDRVHLEQQLRQSQKLESVGTLAGGIAHDFNNILSSVLGFTELSLDDVAKGTPLENNLQEVYTAGKRARDLVKQILTFARQTEEEIKPIKVDIIVKEVLKLIRSSLPTSIEIKQNIESNALIMGNPIQIHQIMMNLCTNAADAMEDDIGVLEISLEDVKIDKGFPPPSVLLGEGDYIKLSVSDTGTGISPSVIGNIFNPYFTTKDVGEGTGMGLAMVHGIVENYGGKITADSKLGKGTTFTIYLPATKKRDASRPYEQSVLPAGTERILLVDDELPIAKMGSQILERLGYQVTVRTGSVEALGLFKEKPNDFDLVITDMTMPNMSGDKLATELMKIRPDIPVIICSGYSRKISDQLFAKIGIKAFAYKPIIRADLAETVRKVLDEAKGTAQGSYSKASDCPENSKMLDVSLRHGRFK